MAIVVASASALAMGQEAYPMERVVIAAGEGEGTVSISPRALVVAAGRLMITRGESDPYAGSGFHLFEARAGLESSFVESVDLVMVARLDRAPGLLEAYASIHPWSHGLSVEVGLFAIPLSVEHDVEASSRQILETPVTRTVTGLDRLLGLAISYESDKRVSARVGAWGIPEDGADPSAFSAFAAAGRIWVDFAGAGAEPGKPPAASAGTGASAGFSLLYRRDPDLPLLATGGEVDLDTLAIGPQAALTRGPFSTVVEVLYVREWTAGGEGRAARLAYPDVDGVAGYLQAGIFAIPGSLEISARFGAMDGDLGVAGWAVRPVVAVTWYILGNNLKLQAEYHSQVPVSEPFPDGSLGASPVIHSGLLALRAAL